MSVDHRLEVEITADRISLVENPQLLILAGKHLAIAQDAVAQRQRRLVQHDDIDGFVVQQALHRIDQRQAAIECLFTRQCLRCKHGNVDIRVWRCTAARAGAKEVRYEHVWLVGKIARETLHLLCAKRASFGMVHASSIPDGTADQKRSLPTISQGSGEITIPNFPA